MTRNGTCDSVYLDRRGPCVRLMALPSGCPIIARLVHFLGGEVAISKMCAPTTGPASFSVAMSSSLPTPPRVARRYLLAPAIHLPPARTLTPQARAFAETRRASPS